MSADLVKAYDPNIRWGFHSFEITYMCWDYSITVVTRRIGGTCRGFDLFSTAIENHAKDLIAEQGDHPVLYLTRPAEDGDGEDSLECGTDVDVDVEDWLKSMCVSVRLVGHEPEKKQEVAG